jgi:choline dehydrogenase-like flavoprotein
MLLNNIFISFNLETFIKSNVNKSIINSKNLEITDNLYNSHIKEGLSSNNFQAKINITKYFYTDKTISPNPEINILIYTLDNKLEGNLKIINQNINILSNGFHNLDNFISTGILSNIKNVILEVTNNNINIELIIEETYDFIIVGSGPAGCVMANRLSENGKYSVCLLEAGRDDARVPQTLPEESTANVPQPGDFNWSQYIRGGITYMNMIFSRGFEGWTFFAKDTETSTKKICYPRGSGWGGSTSVNAAIGIRNPPSNWNSWASLGLTEWSFDKIKDYYKLTENRSQLNYLNNKYYNSDIPNGKQGCFDPTYYGYNGQVPLYYLKDLESDPFINIMNNIVQNVLNVDYGFNYRDGLVDLDYPPTADLGGISLNNFTLNDQFGSIVPPNKNNLVPFYEYNYPLYGDNGFTIPSEFQKLNDPISFVGSENNNNFYFSANGTLEGRTFTQRASAATTYLYSCTGRDNLNIISEAFVTKIITDTNNIDSKIKTVGIEYISGWNVYQTGRNNNVQFSGFGGTNADAKYNSYISKQNIKKIYATKEVILCAGFINSPQILMLSGIGNKYELELLGIKSVKHLEGVGKNFIDNQELFFFWETEKQSPNVTIYNSAKQLSTSSIPEFEIGWKAEGLGVANIGKDPFATRLWSNFRNLPAINQPFIENDFHNTIIDDQTYGNPPTKWVPNNIIPAPNKMGCIIEKQDNNLSRGYIKLISTDPTVPPSIICNYLQHPEDLQSFMNILNNNVFPVILSLKKDGLFKNLLYPASYDILKDGITDFTNMDQINQEKLSIFIKNAIGGHHGGGTCKMGLNNDTMAVVDQDCNVYGIEGLRVCDMSIVPVSIRWPNINLYPIAEKVANKILLDYEK